jgi:hypothetical protein
VYVEPLAPPTVAQALPELSQRSHWIATLGLNVQTPGTSVSV